MEKEPLVYQLNSGVPLKLYSELWSYLNDNDPSTQLARTFEFRGADNITEAVRSWSLITGRSRKDPVMLKTYPQFGDYFTQLKSEVLLRSFNLRPYSEDDPSRSYGKWHQWRRLLLIGKPCDYGQNPKWIQASISSLWLLPPRKSINSTDKDSGKPQFQGYGDVEALCTNPPSAYDVLRKRLTKATKRMGKHITSRITVIGDGLHNKVYSEGLESSEVVKIYDSRKHPDHKKFLQPEESMTKDVVDTMVDESTLPYGFHLLLD